MIRVRMVQVATAVVVISAAGCNDGGPISRPEAQKRAEELQADMLTGSGGQAVRALRELAARPPDRPLRDSAAALVEEIESLFDEVIGMRKELLETAVPEPEDDRRGSLSWLYSRDYPVRAAAEALERAEGRRAVEWVEIRAELERETIGAVDNGMRQGANEKRQLERGIETAKAALAGMKEESEARQEAGLMPEKRE